MAELKRRVSFRTAFRGEADIEPVAIIGMACRLPPAIESPDEFWRFLLSDGDAVSGVPPGRWGDRYFHPERVRPGRSNSKSGAFLTDIAGFDANFFGIPPRVAEWMDPQQRLLLEVAWHAFEDAGQPMERLGGSDTAVFVGAGTTDFLVQRSRHIDSVGPYTMTGVAMSIAANRLSHWFDLRGPSMIIDTACSSALVALHEASQTIRAGQSRMALVGAVNLLLEPFSTLGFAKAGMLSPTGRCHSFDARADGYVRGEGAVAVLLKRLSDAEADGDRIHALILGSAVNSDGRTDGITLPSQEAQEVVLRRAYARAAIPLDRVGYVEAHGTGTPVGDPIECRALGSVLGGARPAGSPLAIGSVKPQTGHLEVAAGLVGLLKAILILKHRAIPATLDFVRPNPEIPFSELNLRVVDRSTPLATGQEPAVVGINAFGFGGTNAHVVLSGTDPAPMFAMTPALEVEAPALEVEAPAPGDAHGGSLTLFLSARSEAALAATAGVWADWLAALPTVDAATDWADLCWTAAHRRSHHPHRLAIHAANAADAAKRLTAFRQNDTDAEVAAGTAPAAARRVALVFTGNGSQWLGMGTDLYQVDADARRTIDHIAAALKALGGVDILPVFTGTAAADCLAATDLAQPALFALQVAMVDWLTSRGMTFSAVIGHSVGELAAAYVAGALSFDDAIRVLHVRSRAQHRTAGRGRMLAAAMAPEDALRRVAPLLGAVAVAAVNTPESVTLAGEARALDAIAASLEEEGVALRRLDLDYGFHSPVMNPIETEIHAGLAGISSRSPRELFVSTVTGTVVEDGDLDAAYWWANIRHPVRFAEAIATLGQSGFDLFVEIGPAPRLSGYIRQCLKTAAATVAVIPTLRSDNPSIPALRHTLGQLYVQGAQLDFTRVPPRAGRVVDLPPYVWDRRQHWVDARVGGDRAPEHPEPVHPLLGDRLPTAQPTWHGEVDTGLFPFLADHRVEGTALLPATAFVELCIAAARQLAPAEPMAIDGLVLRNGLPVDSETVLIETAYTPDDGVLAIRGKRKQDDASWTLHAQARLRRMELPSRVVDLQAVRARCGQSLDADLFYRRCAERGFAYGPRFRAVDAVWVGGTEALCRLGPGPSAGSSEMEPAWHLSPALADACLQLAMVLPLQEGDSDSMATFLPVGIEHVQVVPSGITPAYCHLALSGTESGSPRLEGTILDAAGAVLCALRGIQLQAIPRRSDPQAATETYRQRLHLLDPPVLRHAAGPGNPPLRPSTLLRHCAGAVAELAAGLDRLATSGNWLRRFDALCDAWLARLNRAGDDKHALSTSPAPDPDALWRNLLADAGDRLAELFIAARLGDQLPRLAAGTLGVGELLAASTARNMMDALYDLAPVSRCWQAALVSFLLEAASAQPCGRAFRILLLGDAPTGLVTALRLGLSARGVPWSVATRTRRDATPYDGPKCDAVVVVDPLAADWCAPIPAALRADGLVLAWQRRFGALERLALGRWPAMDGGAPRQETAQDELAPEILAGHGFAEAEIVADRSGLDSGRLVIARQTRPAPLETPATQTAIWLLLIDDPQAGIGATVAALLSQHGQVVVTACLGDGFRSHGSGRYDVAADRPQEFRLLCQALADDGLEAEQVVFLCGLGQADPLASPRRRDLAALYLIQALRAVPWLASPALTLVTGGAHGGGGVPVLPAQAALWGMGRVAMSEIPGLRTRLIDFSPSPETPVESLVAELLWPCGEEEIVLANGERYALRVEAAGDETVAASTRSAEGSDGAACCLTIGRQGVLDSLHFEERTLPPLAPNDVAIRVAAAGLNFRDVAWALRLLPDEAVARGLFGPRFGLECTGVVSALGNAVQGLQPGDRVVAMGPACLATHVVQDASRVHRLPDDMTFQQAATLPVALTTALYALDDAGRLRPGETVLVHAAAGGVGLAAVRLALARGARVLATAGTPEKRDFLQRLGVEAVFDSRGTGFVDDVLAHTRGEGVDVVLNSLSGDALSAGLSLLKPFGRFVEIGKRDLYGDRRIGLRPLRQHGSFHAVDLDRLMLDRPDEALRISRQLGDILASGGARGLPFHDYPFARAEEAFRAMQRGAHIGKIVLSADSPAPRFRPLAGAKRRFDPGGSILVTGGLSGFGLATARWLVEKGARRLILVGRNGPTPAAADICAALRQAGATIDEERADVGDYDAMAAIFARAAARGASISGVVHAAAVYQDAVLTSQDADSFERVMRPKVLGAWNLHRLTQDLQLDFFVLYASASSTIGNGGQANYVAANSYLEALAAWRNAQGLPALAIAWGPIGDVGYLARNEDVRDGLTARWGVTPLTAETALNSLDRLLGEAEGVHIVVPAGWSKALGAAGSQGRTRFRGLAPAGTADGASPAAGPLADWEGLSPAERQSAVETILVEEIGRILHLDPRQVPPDERLGAYGVDSLMAVELSLAVEKRLGIDLRALELTGGSLRSIASRLVERLDGPSAPAPAPAPAVSPASNPEERS